jgi:cobalt-precorrin-5B (C1)-methyltransferase
VLGGISILGTTGFVKPVSSTAYIDSIKTEFDFAIKNNYKTIILTLGNSALKKANRVYKNQDTFIVDIGNFIYDSIKILSKLKHKDTILIIPIAKAVKISQGFKNTHNRFGSIDFDKVQKIIKDIDKNLNIQKSITIKGIKEILENNNDNFDKIVKQKAQQQIKRWFKDMKIKVIIW